LSVAHAQHRARPYARAPAGRLQHRQGGRAARHLAALGGCRSRQRDLAQARSSATAGACPCLWKRNPSPNKRRRNGLSLSTGLCQATRSSAGARPRCHQVPTGRNDCGPGGRRGTTQDPSPPGKRRPRSRGDCGRRAVVPNLLPQLTITYQGPGGLLFGRWWASAWLVLAGVRPRTRPRPCSSAACPWHQPAASPGRNWEECTSSTIPCPAP
jgi:hypothetical protein